VLDQTGWQYAGLDLVLLKNVAPIVSREWHLIFGIVLEIVAFRQDGVRT